MSAIEVAKDPNRMNTHIFVVHLETVDTSDNGRNPKYAVKEAHCRTLEELYLMRPWTSFAAMEQSIAPGPGHVIVMDDVLPGGLGVQTRPVRTDWDPRMIPYNPMWLILLREETRAG